MSDQGDRGLTRRHFLHLGAAGVAAAAGLAALPPEETAEAGAIGKLPRRRCGRTDLEISAVVGASDWNPAVLATAIASGVNYWHKAEAWAKAGLPAALKRQPREAYFLECAVDRVGGHLRGRIDEEAHYQFVRDALRKTGVSYYDVMKFHFGYHTLQEAKADLGMIRAFERLKKEGLVRHLAISQHDYNGNPVNGDKAVDILAYLAEDSPYEAGQVFYTYGDTKEKDDLLALARKHGFGMIAMKTMAGVGRASKDPKFEGRKPGAAIVRWLMAHPNLTAAAIAIANFAQLKENLSAAAQSSTGRQDGETLRLLAAHNKGLTCLLCAECVQRCPEGIAIADILRYERYAHDYDDLPRARAEYAALTKDGSSCAACGDCLPACPAEIDIAARLQSVHRLLG